MGYQETSMSENVAVLVKPMTPDLARDILYRFLTEEEVRIRFATKNREAMHAQIESGEEPTGHRMEWVVACSNALIELLLSCGKSFNQMYPYDSILLGDYLDVLATTRGRFIEVAEGNSKK